MKTAAAIVLLVLIVAAVTWFAFVTVPMAVN